MMAAGMTTMARARCQGILVRSPSFDTVRGLVPVKRSLLHLCLVVAGQLLLLSPAHGGYTHRFVWKQPPEQERLEECLLEMKLIVEAAGAILAGPDGFGKPRIERSELAFNGVDDDDQSHDTFLFPGRSGFNLCKTQGKPYDAAVTACLLVARDHFPPDELEITSDGDWNRDWVNGMQLYALALHRRPKNPMSTNGMSGHHPGQPNREHLPAGVSLVLSFLFFGLLVVIFMRR
jgi:hypothetical protein